jgi:hypothetical protein
MYYAEYVSPVTSAPAKPPAPRENDGNTAKAGLCLLGLAAMGLGVFLLSQAWEPDQGKGPAIQRSSPLMVYIPSRA